jgi:hypothetical protein
MSVFDPLFSVEDPGLWSSLERAIKVEIASRQAWLAEGHFHTLEEARQKVGFIQALQWMLTKANDLKREIAAEEAHAR